jgi:hypothetical protein
MKFINKIISNIEDPYESFKALQRAIAFFCIFIPIFLRIGDHDTYDPVELSGTALTQISSCRDSIKVDTLYRIDSVTQLILKNCRSNEPIVTATIIEKHCLGFRASLSSYPYSSNSYLFGMFYCIAAMMFIYNGITHIKIFKNKTPVTTTLLNKNGSWYYPLIGFSLLMVILNPVHDREILHYIFAVLFFGLNIYAIACLRNTDVDNNGKIKRYITAAIAAIALIISIFIKAVLWGEWISLIIISFHLISVSNSVDLHLKADNK